MRSADADRGGAAPLRALVVDDEALARDDIVQLLGTRTGVTVVGTCANGSDAVSAVRRLHPDILFLDIRMPGPDGFSVIARLPRDAMPYVVFVTAFDGYAIEAFRVRALDYLLKPVQPARLDEALARARDQLRARNALSWSTSVREAAREQAERSAGRGGAWRTEFLLRVGLREVLVRASEIDWVEADTYYARLHVRGRSYLLRERMHALESQLDPQHFARVHRSAIVNLDRVRSIEHDGHGEHVIVLSTGARVKASQQRWVVFRDLMRQRTR